jgi:hypothetical protein
MHSHRPSQRLVGALLLVLLFPACSSEEETPADDPGQNDVAAINEIETCDNVDGRGVATGSIENLGTETASYTIDLEFTDDATGEAVGRGIVAVRSVGPGEAAGWTIEIDGVGDAELSCASKSISAAG